MQHTASAASGGRRILRRPQLREIIPAHDTTVYRWERAGQFPRRVQLGTNSVGWFEDEVNQWLADRERVTTDGR
jgi:prophage regulatory protein